MDKIRSDPSKYPYVASYDLSQATDRLPVFVQEEILAYFLGSDFANS
jgi:hypothetical protein